MAATAYSYIRFSTPEQSEGDSLRRQTTRTEALCKKYGWQLDGRVFRDLGISGYSGNTMHL